MKSIPEVARGKNLKYMLRLRASEAEAV